jgi:hypothetical protein
MIRYVGLALVLALVATSAQATFITVLREGGAEASRDPEGATVYDVTFDLLTIEDDGSTGSAYETDYRFSCSDPDYGLLGVKDMLDYLPANIGDLVSVKVVLVGYQGDNDWVTLSRVATQWLTEAAGGNEIDTSWYESDVDEDVTWAAGSFSATDFTTDDEASAQYSPACYNEALYFDVTNMVLDMVSAGQNAGWLVQADTGTNVYPYADENGTMSKRPWIEIEYIPEPVTLCLLAVGGLALLKRKR